MPAPGFNQAISAIEAQERAMTHAHKTIHVTEYVSIRHGKPRLTREHWRSPPIRGTRF